MGNNYLKIINHFGVNNQQRKLQEEVFELQEAILNRQIHWNYDTEVQDINPFDEHIAEEIADVQLMLNQFKRYYNISDEVIEEIMHFKADRTLKRIESGYYKKPEEV